MKAHELAYELLRGPDIEVRVYNMTEDGQESWPLDGSTVAVHKRTQFDPEPPFVVIE